MIDHVARRDRSDALWPGDGRHAHPGPFLADDLGEVGQAVVHAHDVTGLDASEPHLVIHAGAHRRVRDVLRIEDQFERAGLESALVADVAQEPAFGGACAAAPFELFKQRVCRPAASARASASTSSTL
jgi:hypothetical protein